MNAFDIIVVGGGLAGLTAAIHLSKQKFKVAVFEKQSYPHHKVCGEYISNEIVPYLEYLGISLIEKGAVPIHRMQLSTVEGKSIQKKLPLGGLGISRYALDHILYKKALEESVSFFFDTVTEVLFHNDDFVVKTNSEEISSKLVIGAYGKRSHLDKKLNRDFIEKKSEWLGVKAHYTYENFPDDLVALHNFEGGYGGLSKTETGAINFCYLANYKNFKKEGSIKKFNENVVSKNPFLNNFLKNAKELFKEPMTIAQISFHPKKAVENHMLMCGDTAGLIHPLCGNGMAMAIHSAKIASELIAKHLKDPIFDRKALENEYKEEWEATFGSRLRMGRRLQSVLLNKNLTNFGLRIVAKSPSILNTLIKRTHGKPIAC